MKLSKEIIYQFINSERDLRNMQSFVNELYSKNDVSIRVRPSPEIINRYGLNKENNLLVWAIIEHYFDVHDDFKKSKAQLRFLQDNKSSK